MQTTSAPDAQNTQKTILVVDDDALILKFVSEILASSNYYVITARDGTEALDQARKYNSPIHLLLTDFQMPQMTGMELAQLLAHERPDLKVLMMSGFEGGMLVLNEGWHFLAKPFVVSQLRTLVKNIISSPHE